MWNQGCQSTGGITSHKAVLPSKATLQILPCTVSQLLSAPQVGSDTFTICDWELHQVSIVGIIRGTAPFVTNIQYSVDDMTGPPLSVKQWVNTEASGISIDCAPLSFAAPGTYVKVIGSLRSFSGQRSLLAMDIRCIEDLNEITSHMMEVVQAHMQLFGKGFDVNMNPTTGGHHDRMIPNSLSTIQGQVLDVIRQISVHDTDISFHGLKTQLQDLSMSDIRESLSFLVNEGHVFYTTDEQHFRATDC